MCLKKWLSSRFWLILFIHPRVISKSAILKWVFYRNFGKRGKRKMRFPPGLLPRNFSCLCVVKNVCLCWHFPYKVDKVIPINLQVQCLIHLPASCNGIFKIFRVISKLNTPCPIEFGTTVVINMHKNSKRWWNLVPNSMGQAV